MPLRSVGRGRVPRTLAHGATWAVALASWVSWLTCSGPALAFGGLWSTPGEALDQSGLDVIFVDMPGPSVTALVRLAYAGPAERFAWLIPVRGTPTVELSSSVLFDRLEDATRPRYWLGTELEGTCKESLDFAGAYDDGEPPSPGATSGPVDIAMQGTVGALDYVHLVPDAALADPVDAVRSWLADNGFATEDAERLDPYLREGYGVLAFKLADGAAAGEVRPVRLTYEAERPVVPLRAIRATGDVGIRLWIFGPSHAVPDGTPSLVLNDARIDWSTGRRFASATLPAGGGGPNAAAFALPANYVDLAAAAADEAGGRGLITELAAPASQFRQKAWSDLDQANWESFETAPHLDGIDTLYAAHDLYGGWDGFRDAVSGATTLPEGLTLDAFGEDPNAYRGVAEVDVTRFLELLATRVVEPVQLAAGLFVQAPYLTRFYGVLGADEATTRDLAFTYNFELDQVRNVHIARETIDCVASLRPSDAPWFAVLPQGGVVGSDQAGWPDFVAALPANLKIVSMSAQGAGVVVEDHRARIGTALFGAVGESAMRAPAMLPRPQRGLSIGGPHSVRPYFKAESATASRRIVR